MYMLPDPSFASSRAQAPLTKRTLLASGAVSIVFAVSAGVFSTHAFQAANQLEARPDPETARSVREFYVLEGKSNRVEDVALSACYEAGDATSDCLERTEISETIKRTRQFGTLGAYLSILTTVVAAAAAGGCLGGGGGSSGGSGRTSAPRRRPEDQPFQPPHTIV